MKRYHILLLLPLLFIPIVLHQNKISKTERLNKRSEEKALNNEINKLNNYIESSIVKVENSPSYSSALIIVDSTSRVIDSTSQTIETEVFKGAKNQIREFSEIKSALELGFKSESDPIFAALFLLNYHTDNGKILKFLQDTTRSLSVHQFDSLILKSANKYLKNYSNDTLAQAFIQSLLPISFPFDKLGETVKANLYKQHLPNIRDRMLKRKRVYVNISNTIKHPPKADSSLISKRLQRESDTTSFNYYLKTKQIKKAEELIRKTHILNVSPCDLSGIVRYFCENGNLSKAQHYFNLLNNRRYRYGDYEERGMCHIFFASYYYKHGNTVKAQKHIKQGLSYKKYTDFVKYKRSENWKMFERIKREAAVALAKAGQFSQAITMAAKVEGKDGPKHWPQLFVLKEYAKTKSATELMQFIETSLSDSSINWRMRRYLDLTYINLTEFYCENNRKDDAQIFFDKTIEQISSKRGKEPKIRRLIEAGILRHKYDLEISDKSQESLRDLIQHYCPVGEIREMLKRDL